MSVWFMMVKNLSIAKTKVFNPKPFRLMLIKENRQNKTKSSRRLHIDAYHRKKRSVLIRVWRKTFFLKITLLKTIFFKIACIFLVFANNQSTPPSTIGHLSTLWTINCCVLNSAKINFLFLQWVCSFFYLFALEATLTINT